MDDLGDDGQYIEIWNPYDVTIDVTDWSIRGAGPAVTLRGKIPGGGLLVLTDDYNEENDPTPEYQSSLGSFYRIFGTVPTGAKKRLDEYPSLDLPNDRGEVELLDDKGRTIDVFAYEGGRWSGATRSFQRNDPRVRRARLLTATPLRVNGAAEAAGDAARTALQVQQQWHNRPFRNALDVMLVASAWGEPDLNASQTAGEDWALPLLGADDSRRLDIGLIDCFQVGVVIPQREPLDAEWRENRRLMGRVESGPDRIAGLPGATLRSVSSVPLRPACDVMFGRLNLNTASPATLSALPGMDDALLERIVGVRAQHLSGSPLSYIHMTPQQGAWWLETDPLGPAVWRNLSDFLQDERLWQGLPLYDRLDRVYAFLPLVTTHSVSLWSLMGNREVQPREEVGEKRKTMFQIERVLTADRGRLETILFKYYGRGSVTMGDPDLRFSRVIAE
jgi:hypothetical protein